MHYVNMQKQLIADYTLRKRELNEDEDFLESQLAESRVTKAQTRVNIYKKQGECNQQNHVNQTMVRDIHQLRQHAAAKAAENSQISEF